MLIWLIIIDYPQFRRQTTKLGFIGEFQRLLTPRLCVHWYYTPTVCIATCDVGILRAERYFVILDFFFVILDVLEVISETQLVT